MHRTFVFFALFSSFVFADAKHFYFERYQEKQSTSRSTNETEKQVISSGTYDQAIDPQNPDDKRTFKQRYYVNNTYGETTKSPIILFLCGEATCRPTTVQGGAALKHAQKLKAHLIALEHRYYGKSQPFPQLTTENMKYLSTPNALADTANFIEYIRETLALKGKIVVMGGSYPGSLAAYMRLKYPELVVGALASSGPVQAKENFEEYDHHIATVVGPQCLASLKKAVREIEDALGDAEKLAAIKAQFEGTVLTDDVDFMYMVADQAAFAVQYGQHARFCQLVNTANPLAGYAQFTREIFFKYGMNALSGSAAGAVSTNPADYEAVFGMRQWLYQSCTEYGYWQNAYHDETESARSKLINLAYHRGVCKRLFDLDVPVDEQKTNAEFYHPLLKPQTTNILFTNGSNDPWMKLSIAKENGNVVNPNIRAITIANASHCADFSAAGSAAVIEAQNQFVALAQGWLK